MNEVNVSHQEMHHGPPLMQTLAHSYKYTQAYLYAWVAASSITLTHPSPNGNLHRWRFVMMSPSSPPSRWILGALVPNRTPLTPPCPPTFHPQMR